MLRGVSPAEGGLAVDADRCAVPKCTEAGGVQPDPGIAAFMGRAQGSPTLNSGIPYLLGLSHTSLT